MKPPPLLVVQLAVILALFSVMTSASIRSALQQSHPAKTTWAFDDMRAKIERHKEQEAFADAFSKTNTDPQRVAMVEVLNFDWRPQKGQIELGYRSDGTVVWRTLPEGK